MSLGPNRELEMLWQRPLVSALFGNPDYLPILAAGVSVEDVLAELYGFGDVHTEALPGVLERSGRRRPKWRCTLTLRDQSGAQQTGVGQTVTAAALRCLLDTLAEWDELAEQVTAQLEAYMHGHADIERHTEEGIVRLMEFLRVHDGAQEAA